MTCKRTAVYVGLQYRGIRFSTCTLSCNGCSRRNVDLVRRLLKSYDNTSDSFALCLGEPRTSSDKSNLSHKIAKLEKDLLVVFKEVRAHEVSSRYFLTYVPWLDNQRQFSTFKELYMRLVSVTN